MDGVRTFSSVVGCIPPAGQRLELGIEALGGYHWEPALAELGIGLGQHAPLRTKSCVERLRDRLVVELRLVGIT